MPFFSPFSRLKMVVDAIIGAYGLNYITIGGVFLILYVLGELNDDFGAGWSRVLTSTVRLRLRTVEGLTPRECVRLPGRVAIPLGMR